MKTGILVVLVGLVVASVADSVAQTAGSTLVSVSVEELREVATGWSAKKQILRQPVYNEQKQKVGVVDDLIIAPDTAVSFVIIGAGGFVGVGRHDVAIPVNQLKQENGKIVLPGATKEAIKALPKFEYAKK